MRPIAGADIIDFYNGRDALLVLTADGEFTAIDYADVAYSPLQGTRADAYTFITTEDGVRAQVLLERSTIDDGEWFPDALDDEGDLVPSIADEMAAIINNDGILPSRAMKAVDAGNAWKKATEEADRRAMERAHAVAEVVAYCGGNQSAAARVLGLDQSTVNKLVRKASTR